MTEMNAEGPGLERLEGGPRYSEGSNFEDGVGPKLSRHVTRSSVPGSIRSGSSVDSEDSDGSVDTEEDVCFPMDPENNRLRGIDFDELQQFIDEQRQEQRYFVGKASELLETAADSADCRKKRLRLGFMKNRKLSKAALKYVPKWLQKPAFVGQSSGLVGNSESSEPEYGKPEDDSERMEKPGAEIPNRFSLFTSGGGSTIHSPDLPSLVRPGQSVKDLFGGTEDGDFVWWLDCWGATDSEIKILSRAFGIHRLTAEDIRMSENREKVEFFKDYYFITFHSFESDHESEEFLEPVNFYMVVFKSGILTFHFGPAVHGINVRRRIRQLKDYVPLSSDWICYALIDNITDSFFPVINAIDYETDVLEASVFVIREADFSSMLHRIGESRRKVMTLNRLLSGKADVLRMLFKRCHDLDSKPGLTPTLCNLTALNNAIIAASAHGNDHGLPTVASSPHSAADPDLGGSLHPRADIALFLGDIQDHIITMNMNLSSYEKILARSYTNYLAQIQVESFNTNNKVTLMLSKVTLIGTVLVPLNVITGLFGMNVVVPGQNTTTLAWWFGILGVIIVAVISGVLFANWWTKRVNNSIEQMNRSNDDSRSFVSRVIHRGRSFARRNVHNQNTQSILSFPDN